MHLTKPGHPKYEPVMFDMEMADELWQQPVMRMKFSKSCSIAKQELGDQGGASMVAELALPLG